MSTIRVKCIDHTLTMTNTPVIASGGIQVDSVAFSFCPLWDGFYKTAVFWRDEAEVYHVILDETNSCQIPNEVLTSDGVVFFGVFGVNNAGVRRTSNVIRYHIERGAITEGTQPSDPTPDIYTQLLTKYQRMIDLAEELKVAELAFEQAVNNDQAIYEQALNKAFEDYKQEIRDMVAAGLLPDDSITTEKLKNGVVTAEKIAPGVLIDAYSKTQSMTATTAALFGLGASAVPNDALAVIKNLIDGNKNRINANEADIANRTKIAVGTYTGNMDTMTVTVNLGFKPKFVFIFGCNYIMYSENQNWAGYVGHTYLFSSNSRAMGFYGYGDALKEMNNSVEVEFLDNGFTLTGVVQNNKYYYGPVMDFTYNYVAFG